jgi:hypothetical protein
MDETNDNLRTEQWSGVGPNSSSARRGTPLDASAIVRTRFERKLHQTIQSSGTVSDDAKNPENSNDDALLES